MNLKMVELKLEMTKELSKIEKNSSDLHGKVNVLGDALAKSVEYNTIYSTTLDEKSPKDSKVFSQLEEFFTGVKDSITNVAISYKSYVSLESIL
ncbi:unnamed protein product [Lactuca saligna]|uniref:Uncharacterized protein n=1 Tax=Lactuca saligna TaxID=75948 RepID=A0AA35VIJ5_LACSI|nr:unnamed protein product [Lactuca saligna]